MTTHWRSASDLNCRAFWIEGSVIEISEEPETRRSLHSSSCVCQERTDSDWMLAAVSSYGCTSWITFPELGLKVASPGYFALIVWIFAFSEDVVNVATPLAVVPVPIAVAPS